MKKIKISKKTIIIIAGVVFFFAFIILMTQFRPGNIYFDNGYNKTFEIFIDGEKIGEVGPLKFMWAKSVKNGGRKIEIKENGKLFDSSEVEVKGAKFVYNIGGKNTYYVVTHQYAKSGVSIGPHPRKISSEKFFYLPNVDFVLTDPPEKIEVKTPTTIVVKTSLQRETDLKKFYKNSED